MSSSSFSFFAKANTGNSIKMGLILTLFFILTFQQLLIIKLLVLERIYMINSDIISVFNIFTYENYQYEIIHRE